MCSVRIVSECECGCDCVRRAVCVPSYLTVLLHSPTQKYVSCLIFLFSLSLLSLFPVPSDGDLRPTSGRYEPTNQQDKGEKEKDSNKQQRNNTETLGGERERTVCQQHRDQRARAMFVLSRVGEERGEPFCLFGEIVLTHALRLIEAKERRTTRAN